VDSVRDVRGRAALRLPGNLHRSRSRDGERWNALPSGEGRSRLQPSPSVSDGSGATTGACREGNPGTRDELAADVAQLVREDPMKSKLLTGLAGVAAFVAMFVVEAPRGGAAAGNSPPTITFVHDSAGGLPAISADVVDPDGASDILGIGYTYVLDDGSNYLQSTQLTFFMVGKHRLSVHDVQNGKHVSFTQVPNGISKITFTVIDKCLHTYVATVDVPADVKSNSPTITPPKKPGKPKGW
jgi:hypothetical protein